MPEPISAAAGLASAAASSLITLYKFGSSLKEVPTETRIFLDLVTRVSKDLETLESSYRVYKPQLFRVPHQMQRIESVITDASTALFDVSNVIEEARGQLVNKSMPGHIDLKTRLRWVLESRDKFNVRLGRLQTCQMSMIPVQNMLDKLTIDNLWAP